VTAWAVVVALTLLASWGFGLLVLPSPQLFGALFAGMIYAVSGRGTDVQLPGWARWPGRR